MSVLQVFSLVIAVLAFMVAIYVGFFSGEKYMMWYFRHIGDGKQYDLKKFRIVHAGCTAAVAVCFLLYGFLKEGYVVVLFVSVLVVIQQILFNKVCKK